MNMTNHINIQQQTFNHSNCQNKRRLNHDSRNNIWPKSKSKPHTQSNATSLVTGHQDEVKGQSFTEPLRHKAKCSPRNLQGKGKIYRPIGQRKSPELAGLPIKSDNIPAAEVTLIETMSTSSSIPKSTWYNRKGRPQQTFIIKHRQLENEETAFQQEFPGKQSRKNRLEEFMFTIPYNYYSSFH